MKRRHWLVAGPVVFATAALGLGGVSCVRSKGPTPRQVEQQIRVDVPLGTSRTAVEDYLRQRGLEFITTDGEVEDKLNGVPVVDLSDIGNQIPFSKILAYVEPAFVDAFWNGEVKIWFLFDHKERLIGYFFLPWAHTL